MPWRRYTGQLPVLVTGLAPGGNCELHPAWWIRQVTSGYDGYTDGPYLWKLYCKEVL